MGGSPVAVHTRSTDWPITTGGNEPGCIVVPLGGSEDAVRLSTSMVSYKDIYCIAGKFDGELNFPV